MIFMLIFLVLDEAKHYHISEKETEAKSMKEYICKLFISLGSPKEEKRKLEKNLYFLCGQFFCRPPNFLDKHCPVH